LEDPSSTDTFDKVESIRIITRFKTSITTGFHPTKLVATEDVTDRKMVHEDSHGILPERAINCIRATEHVQHEIIDDNRSSSLEDAEALSMLFDLNESLAPTLKNFEANGPVQAGPSRELVAAHKDIEELGLRAPDRET
jgi:hypothetical protein